VGRRSGAVHVEAGDAVNIVIGSAFRNSGNYLLRYFQQVAALQKHVGAAHTVRVIAVEGDSADHTREALPVVATVPLTHVKHDHGKPWFGSTESPERMREMSKIGNLIFDHVMHSDDVLVYVESDLIWDAHTVGSLIDMAIRQDSGFDVFAPMVFAGENFYDTWGFRGMDGQRWSPFAPFHSQRNLGFTQVKSAGSCLVMRSEVARNTRIIGDNCLVGWCEHARSGGYKIAVHSDFKVNHPC